MNKITTPFVYRLDTANIIKDNTLLFNYNIIYQNVEVYHNSDVHIGYSLISILISTTITPNNKIFNQQVGIKNHLKMLTLQVCKHGTR